MKKDNWKLPEQALFLRRLGELLQKGYSLLQGLEFLHVQMTETRKSQISQAVFQLKKGNTLHDVLHYLGFHSDILSYLFYAEKHGDIAFACVQAGEMMERKIEQQAKLSKILRYPLFLLSFMVVILLFFNAILLPQFQQLFQSMQTDTTSFTTVVFFVIGMFPKVFLAILLCVIFLWAYYYFVFRKFPPLKKMNLILRIPYIKKVVRMTNTHYFSIQLGSLLKGGLSILEALHVMESQIHHPFFKEEATRITCQLRNGCTLEQMIQTVPYYEGDFLFVIEHGQANGTLSMELGDYSEYVLEKIEEYLKGGIQFVQPVIYLVVAGVVVMVYVAMMLPIFQLINSV